MEGGTTGPAQIFVHTSSFGGHASIKFGSNGAAASSRYMIGQADGSVASNLQFRRGDDFTTGATTMTLDGTGNVGIGTTGPGAKLAIQATSGDTKMIQFLRTDGSEYGSIWGHSVEPTSSAGNITIEMAGSAWLRVHRNGNVDMPGNVGIGTTAPTEKLEVSGNIKASGTVSQGSSKEIKKNISSVSTKDAIKALNKLNPVRFEYKTDNSGEKHLGFIAEDVPDLVAEEDRKHLNSMDITAVLTKVVQEQQRMLLEQKRSDGCYESRDTDVEICNE